jgi:hypothetical protein
LCEGNVRQGLQSERLLQIEPARSDITCKSPYLKRSYRY